MGMIRGREEKRGARKGKRREEKEGKKTKTVSTKCLERMEP